MFSLSNRDPALPRPGRGINVALSAAVAVLSVLLGACTDLSTAPNRSMSATNSASRSQAPSTLTPAQGLLRTKPLLAPVVVVKTLSRDGGSINVPGTDFQLQVPKDAFAEPTMTFTITAYSGNAVAYDFQPHGVTWLKPLKAVQQLSHTNWKDYKLPSGTYWSGAYFANPSQVNILTGEALVNEFMESAVQVGGATMTWSLPHFSGYLVAAGRMADDEY